MITMEPDSKEYIIASIQQALTELKEVKAGRIKARPARELLEELRAAENDTDQFTEQMIQKFSGTWSDSLNAEEIIEDIYNSRLSPTTERSNPFDE